MSVTQAGSTRHGVLHSDGSITILRPEATATEASSEALLVSASETDPASAVRVQIAEIEHLGPRVGSTKV